MPGNQKYWTSTEILNQTYWKYLVSLEMSSDPKNYFGCAFDEFTEYIAQLLFIIDVHKHLWDCRSRPQKDLPNSDWNPQSNLLTVFGVSLEISSDPKKYFAFTFDEFGEYFWLPGI